eukprot:1278033-Prymnesium_polylepis.4
MPCFPRAARLAPSTQTSCSARVSHDHPATLSYTWFMSCAEASTLKDPEFSVQPSDLVHNSLFSQLRP